MRLSDFLREVAVTSTIFEQKVVEATTERDTEVQRLCEEYGIIFDPNVIDWVHDHVESSDLHLLWTLALTLYFEKGLGQGEVSRSLGFAQPYISRRAKQFLTWMEKHDN